MIDFHRNNIHIYFAEKFARGNIYVIFLSRSIFETLSWGKRCYWYGLTFSEARKKVNLLSVKPTQSDPGTRTGSRGNRSDGGFTGRVGDLLVSFSGRNIPGGYCTMLKWVGSRKTDKFRSPVERTTSLWIRQIQFSTSTILNLKSDFPFCFEMPTFQITLNCLLGRLKVFTVSRTWYWKFAILRCLNGQNKSIELRQ